MYRAKRIDNGKMIEGEAIETHCGTVYLIEDWQIHPRDEKTSKGGTDIAIIGAHETVPDTLEIKIGDNWFSPEYVESIFKKLGEFGLKKLMKE